jgi:hypothetical protein
MVSPEFQHAYDHEASYVEADFDLLPKDHLAAQAFLISAGNNLSRYFNADHRQVQLADVPLTGGVPLILQDRLGVGYRAMDINIVQSPSSDDNPALKLILKASELNPDMVITTDAQAAQTASEKFFWAKYADTEDGNYLRGDDVGTLLDAVLRTGGQLGNATDPRKRPLSVNSLVTNIEQICRKKASQPTETLTFNTDKYDFAVLEQAFLPYERHASLEIKRSGNITGYRLKIFGLHNIGSNPDLPATSVTEQLSYSFEKAKTVNARHLRANIILSSRELDRPELARALQMPNANWHPERAIHRAVKEIFETKTQQYR